MANYYATSRSSYFRVRDAEAFKAWVNKFENLGYWEELNDVEGEDPLFGIFAEGGWPSDYRGDFEEACSGDTVDFNQELSEHLAEGWVAILMSAGAEKFRYVAGFADAVAWTGEVVSISLSDIYLKAANVFGNDINRTEAEY